MLISDSARGRLAPEMRLAIEYAQATQSTSLFGVAQQRTQLSQACPQDDDEAPTRAPVDTFQNCGRIR